MNIVHTLQLIYTVHSKVQELNTPGPCYVCSYLMA